ncbi:glycosyltransferase family 4 protein [Nesterenkonia sp. Act20]|uniref:glycosyltransferase family 4 protein n=1 Tax=Nesterenkonia sp. Act20 TaxID=1483432 RepID=UPI001C472CD1|nr:glycosyltransferase family 4 protein [Nesterenkonia sp. Act20]
MLVPRDLPGPSGGTTYNTRVLAAWRSEGLDVTEAAVPGSWPHPSREDRLELRETLRQHPRVLIDGIIASAAPTELARAAADGTEIAVLVHLPLPAESGLSPAQRARLAASERAALETAHAVVATSAWAREDLEARYQLGGVAVAEPGVDTADLTAGSTPPRLFMLGALTPRKNALLLLQALTSLQDLAWDAVFAGPDGQDPGYAERLRRASTELPAGRVSFPGAIAGKELNTLWRSTDLLILPSVAETYGMVVTEALAHGIPAMVGAGTGAEEALRGPGTGGRAELESPGTALDPGDAATWARTLRHWLEDDALRHRWKSAAEAHRARMRAWSDAAQDLRTAIHW